MPTMLSAALLLASAMAAQVEDEQGVRLRALLAAADERIARPADRLESLDIDVPFVVPAPLAAAVLQQLDPRAPGPPEEPVELALVQVRWHQGEEPEITVVPDEGARLDQPMLSQALLPQAEARGRQVLDMVLNPRPDVDRLLTDFEPDVTAQPDGATRVVLLPRRPDELAPLLRLEWSFGPDGLPRETVTVSRLPEEAGADEVRSTQVSHWGHVDGSERLHLLRLESSQDAGALGTARTDLTLHYEEVDGLPLLVELQEEANGPGLSYSLRTRLRNVRLALRP